MSSSCPSAFPVEIDGSCFETCPSGEETNQPTCLVGGKSYRRASTHLRESKKARIINPTPVAPLWPCSCAVNILNPQP